MPVGADTMRPDQRNRILQGEPRARTDREMRGMRGIAEQHAVAVHPVVAPQARKPAPDGMIANQRRSFERIGKKPGTGLDRGALIHFAESMCRETLRVALDDESAHRGRVSIMMCVQGALPRRG